MDSSNQFITSPIPVDLVLNCLIATNAITSQRLLLIEIPSGEQGLIADQRFKGVEIQTLEIRSVFYVAIILIDNRFSGIFNHFAEDVLNDIRQATVAREGLLRAAEVIISWRRMFQASDCNYLSPEAQKGLYGELHVLRLLIENGSFGEVVEAWQGPDRANQDFVFSHLRIEVKATSVNQPSLKITNEHQLRNQPGIQLFLYLLIFDIQPGNTETLVSMISEIRQRLISYPSVMEVFNQKLISAGCLDDDFEHYDNTRYILRDEHIFLVSEDFPVLTSDTIPLGIFQTSYQIELSAVLPFAVSPEQLFNRINSL